MSDVAAVETTEGVPEEAKQPTAAPKAAKEKKPPHYHVNEMKTGKRDPFTAAFNEAQDEVREEEDEDDEPEPVVKKQPAPVKKAEPEAKPKEAPEPKPEKKAEAAEEEDDDEAEIEPKVEAKEPEPKKEKGPLEPKKWWSNRKREAFKFQPRHVQEAWLKEAPQPDQRWSDEQKTAFGKLPSEGKELLLERHQEIERGYGEKFEGLAKERKLAEDIQKAVPPQMRSIMEQRGITESQMLAKLSQQQLFAWQNPKGYIAKFIADAKINPADLFQNGEGGTQPALQQHNPAAQDIRAHPDFQAMAARVRELEEERQKAAESDDERFESEFQGLLGETDGEGNSLYPFIRVLAGPMATIIENNADRLDGLSIRDRLAAAYFQALEDFPELTAIHMTAPTQQADEPEAKKADSDGENERVAKLEKAVTPKSQTPSLAPASSSGDPFEKAFASAKKQLGKR